MRYRALSMTAMALLLGYLQEKGHVSSTGMWVIFVAAAVLAALHESFAIDDAKAKAERVPMQKYPKPPIRNPSPACPLPARMPGPPSEVDAP